MCSTAHFHIIDVHCQYKKEETAEEKDEKIGLLWEALMMVCMEIEDRDPADALMHAMELYRKAPEMMRLRKEFKGDRGEPIGNIIARRICKKYGIEEYKPNETKRKRKQAGKRAPVSGS